ncbi:MAG: hypothetical protein K8S16_14525 [Bacteroidales bacterium]|nr:hypothetical protein [Bacteroidales bacterium]
MKNILLLIFLLIYVSVNLYSQAKEVPFMLDDRDRLIRTEAEIKSLRNEIGSLRNEMKTEIGSLRNEMNLLRNEMNYKFESIQTQINDVKTFLYWGFGFLFSAMLFLIGFVIWDRRTTVAPVKKENERIIEALTEYSKENPKLAEILRSAGIL